jgi:uncharacterized membrane protein
LGRRNAALALAILVLVSTLPIVKATAPTPQSLLIELHPDGFASVVYTLTVDQKIPEANITTFGQILIDLAVVDAENLPLSYTMKEAVLRVNTLGTDTVKITYTTQDLSNKDGRFWVINLTTQIKTTILLPAKATLVEFDPIPDLMESQGDKVLLIMPQGSIKITYVTSVIGTKEYAQVVLRDAKDVIDETKSQGILIKPAEDLLQQAQAAFNQGDYIKAETQGKQAREVTLQIKEDHSQAKAKIEAAENEIAQAEKESRTTLIEEARQLLEESNTKFNSGNYTQASVIADQTSAKANASEVPFPTTTVVGATLGLAVLGALYLLARPKAVKHKTPRERKPIDVEKHLKRDDLREDEKDAIRIISENNDEIPEAELYTKLSLPRTTTWRLVKRLEKMGIVEITKVRRSNVIRLKR